MDQNLKMLLGNHPQLFVQQIKEWVEILVNFETRNKYEILDNNGKQLGFMAERAGGIWRTMTRFIFRSHRPMEVDIWDAGKNKVLELTRPFFWFFSDMDVIDGTGNDLGQVKRRFGILYKKYDLVDNDGEVFAHIKGPIWRLWTFPIYDLAANEVGVVSKEWGGLLKEVFTDADKFKIDFGPFKDERKAVVFAAAISIDMDFFEDNHDGSDD